MLTKRRIGNTSIITRDETSIRKTKHVSQFRIENSLQQGEFKPITLLKKMTTTRKATVPKADTINTAPDTKKTNK